ncbi:MAG: hypothetical protein HY791_35950 [Deltaproteobacteria bacterium]|nr:hypothetical protein [Deltaproteobacteria bacterium]
MKRVASLLTVFALLPGTTACEEDTLNTSGNFDPAECETSPASCNRGLRLDAGSPNGVPTDGGANGQGDGDGSTSGVTDAGANPSSSGADAGSSGPPLVFLDLSGQYATAYELEAPSLGDISDATGFVYSLLTGISTGNPVVDVVLGPILRSIVNPNAPWVATLAGALNALTAVLSDTTAQGVMRLTQDPPANGTVRLHGRESWSVMTVLVVDRCVGRNPSNPPGCAELPINVSGSSGPPRVDLYSGQTLTIDVNVHDFEGTLQPVTMSLPHEADFELSDRDVDVDLAGILHIAIDFIIDALTFYNPPHFTSLRDLIVYGCNDISTGITNAPVRIAFLGACVNYVADGIDDLIRQIVVGTGYHLDQRGHAVDSAPFSGHADVLQQISVRHSIDGELDVGLGSPSAEGQWSGSYIGP